MIALSDNNTFGDFFIDGNKFATDFTLHTIVYISLFGGNFQADTPIQRRPAGVANNDWWGNLFQIQENEPLFNSKLERNLNNLALISGNLKLFESAAKEDLIWLITKKIVKSINISARIAAPEKLELEIFLKKPNDVEEKFSFLWDATLAYFQDPGGTGEKSELVYDVLDGGSASYIPPDVLDGGSASYIPPNVLDGGSAISN